MKRADFDRWAKLYCLTFALDGAQVNAVASWQAVFEREKYLIEELDAATIHLSGPRTKARTWPEHLPSIHDYIQGRRKHIADLLQQARENAEREAAKDNPIFGMDEKARKELRRKMARQIGKKIEEN